MSKIKYNNTEKFVQSEPDFIEDSAAPWDLLVDEDNHIKVFKDKYPVTAGHLLYIPKYNTIAVLTDAFNNAVRFGVSKVQKNEWHGFNVGLNYGLAAGQTVPWPHIHLIPRMLGDMKDPTGGVRHVIPEKGNYKK